MPSQPKPPARGLSKESLLVSRVLETIVIGPGIVTRDRPLNEKTEGGAERIQGFPYKRLGGPEDTVLVVTLLLLVGGS
jgi:hypothetical protein